MEPRYTVCGNKVHVVTHNLAGPPMTIYFCGEFDIPPDRATTFSGRNTFPAGRHYRTFDNVTILEPTFEGDHASSGPLTNRVGALFTWNSKHSGQLKSRVGVSFISIEKACAFKNDEVPSWILNDTMQAARDEWNHDVFSKIRVSTGPSANKTRLSLLYSSLYFMHLIPSDRTGENPLWSSEEPYWDDFYTLCMPAVYIEPLPLLSVAKGICFATQ